MSSSPEPGSLDASPNITVTIPRGRLTFSFHSGSKLAPRDFDTIQDSLQYGRDCDFNSVITTLSLEDCQAAPAHDRLLICSIPDRKILRNGSTTDVTSECPNPVADLICAALRTINHDDPITPEGATALTFLRPQNDLPKRDQRDLVDPPDGSPFSFIRFDTDYTTFTFVRVNDENPAAQPDKSIWQSIPQALKLLKDSQTDIVIIRTNRSIGSLAHLVPDLLTALEEIAPKRCAIASTLDRQFLTFDRRLNGYPTKPEHTEAAQQFGPAAPTHAHKSAEYQAIAAHFGNPLTTDEANALSRVAFASASTVTDSPTIISYFQA